MAGIGNLLPVAIRDLPDWGRNRVDAVAVIRSLRSAAIDLLPAIGPFGCLLLGPPTPA